MEADVAIQHSAEKWAAGESLYEQPEKVTFIYRSQKKGRGHPAPRQLPVKPSRSYDNELEASVFRDMEEGSRVTKVQDDLIVGFEKEFERNPETLGGNPVQCSLKFPPQYAGERYVVKEKRTYIGEGKRGHKKTRWKSKPEFGETTSHKSRNKYPIVSQQTDFWVEDIQGHSAMTSQDGGHRPIPIEFHLKEDQFPVSGPSMQCKRHINLSSKQSASSLPSSSKEKPSSFVIVEVKDGPTFFYKHSDHMLSDSGIDDEVMVSSNYRPSLPLPPGRQQFAVTKEPYPADPARNPSFSAYAGNFSFSKPENSPFSSFRSSSSSGLYHVDSGSIGAAVPSLADSPKSRSAISQLPRTPGLRKPDLSVLTTPNRKGSIPEDNKSCGLKGCGSYELLGEEEVETTEKRPLLVPTVLPMTSSRATPHYTDFLPQVSTAQTQGIVHPISLTQPQKFVYPVNVIQPQNVLQPQNVVQNQNVFHPQNIVTREIAVQFQNVFRPQHVPSQVSVQPHTFFQPQNILQPLNVVQHQKVFQPENAFQPQNYIQSQNCNQPLSVLQPQNNVQPTNVVQPFILGIDPSADTRNPHQSAGPDNGIQSSVPSHDLVMSTALAYDPNSVFQNTSEIVQQKAGIKHDDIVVGPRRARGGGTNQDGRSESGTLFQDAEYAQNSLASKKQEVQTPATSSMTPKLNLSASTDGLSSGHLNVFLENESLRRKDIRSESDFSVAGMPTMGSKPNHHAPMSSLNPKEEHAHSSKNFAKAEPHCPVTAEAIAPRLVSERYTNISDGVYDSVESGTKLTLNERKDFQRVQQGERLSGHSVDISRTKTANLEICPETGTTYTKSLDRNHKSVGEAKALCNLAIANPAKQHLHSPKSKSSSATHSRKLPVSSKLHMLSNIPVPISHDPPAKRYRPLSTPEATDTNVPSIFYKELVTAKSDSPKDNEKPVTELSKETLVPSAPQFFSNSSAQPSTQAPVVDIAAQDINISTSQTGGCLIVSTNPLNSETSSQANSSLNQRAGDTNITKEDISSRTTIQSEVNRNLTSTAAFESSQKVKETTSSSSCHLPAKPRLHRSTEHLLGDAKLTVFNSEENVPSFETLEASSSRPFQDSAKLEKAGCDRISPLKKAHHELAKAGIMRRGSDRTEMYRRGSDRAFLPISHNDPSVEDLKKATSLRELCQSMASLLNIDNVKAAEMITTSLSHRQDLVEGLDADAILDYLSHHGVLDPGILVGLDDKATVAQRNSAIIRHVEEHGNTAVALFINALRQSGQLHLASSLDTEQRIKPVSGNGYFGKDRHKGEITIRIEIESLKIVAPREPRHDKIVDTTLLGSPGRQGDDSGILIKDATDEEDFVKPRCWCFCFSYKSKIKTLSKKDIEKQKKSVQTQQRCQPSFPEIEPKPSEEVDKKDPNTKPHRTKSQEKTKKGKESATEGSKKDLSKSKEKDGTKKLKSSKSKSKVSGKNSLINITDGSAADFKSEVACHLRAEEGHGFITGESDVSKRAGLRPYILQQEQTTKQHRPYNGVGDSLATTNQGPKPDKEAWDPIIMEYNPKLELIKLRAGQEELASPTRQSGNIGIMCEQWKSNGRHFQQKASQLCEKIVEELHTDIIKYFEQDRGTLVLDVVSDISSILVFNICMMRAQVKCLQEEIADDSLLNKIQDMFFSRVDIAKFEIRGIKLRITLDEPELNIVLSELS